MENNPGGLLSGFTQPLNWKETAKRLEELSDPVQLEKIVNQKMEELLRKEHPDDYDNFILENKDELDKMRKRFITKYSYDLGRKAKLAEQIAY